MDLMMKADDKAAWDAYVSGLPEDIASVLLIDEIGPIVITPAVLDEDGEIVEEAVVDLSHHVNVRVTRPTIQSGGEEPVDIDVCALIAEGGEGVHWISPEIVTSPERIWAGGMNYWMPGNNEVTE
jgi:hypothetical protein